MYACISSFTFHRAFENGQLDAVTFPAFCRKEFGVRRVEYFDPDLFYAAKSPPALMDMPADHAHVKEVRKACDAAGVEVVAIAAQNDFTDPDENKRRADINRVRHWLEVAPALGARLIRINSGNWFSKPGGAKRLKSSLEEIAPEAKSRDLTLVVENHPTNMQSVEEAQTLTDIVLGLNEYGVGTCPDNGHIASAVWADCLDMLLLVAKHCHVKFHTFDKGGNEPTIDYGRYFELLTKNNYAQVLSVEAVPPPTPLSPFCRIMITEKTLSKLRENEWAKTVIPKIEALEGRAFGKASELEEVLRDCLSPDEVGLYRKSLIDAAEKEFPGLRELIEFTGRGIELLRREGVEL